MWFRHSVFGFPSTFDIRILCFFRHWGFRISPFMFVRLLLLLITVPLVELALLLYLADHTSWTFTLAMVLVTGLTGSWLARSQGWRVWRQMQTDLAAGRLPTDSLLDAALIFVAGALLLTPGVLTDLVAIGLLIPPTRRLARRGLGSWLRSRFHLQTAGFGESFRNGRSEVLDSYVVTNPPPDRERIE
jgi:UPF0716 protein FxsA